MKRLLVTGFGPFPGIRSNPSSALARLLARDLRLARAGIAVTHRLIPTTYADADALIPALVAQRPDAVLMLGVAGKRRGLSVEMRARNRLATLAPDASGRRPARLALKPGGSPALAVRASVPRLVKAGQGHGLGIAPSRNAGAYLCNYSYWHMLEQLPGDVPCVFIHVPKLGQRRLKMAADALSAMAKILVR